MQNPGPIPAVSLLFPDSPRPETERDMFMRIASQRRRARRKRRVDSAFRSMRAGARYLCFQALRRRSSEGARVTLGSSSTGAHDS
jgi:hypothetical protein